MNIKSSIVPVRETFQEAPSSNWLVNWARHLVLKQLSQIQYGELVIREGGQETYLGDFDLKFPVRVVLEVDHPSAWTDVAFGGSTGSGEAYMKGSWHCSDLVGLIRVFLRNREVLDSMDSRLSRIKLPLHKMLHWMSQNSRSGSQRNISAHYDLGNDFFRLFLDPTMMYSSAVYSKPEMTLDEASVAKLDKICKKLDLQPDDHVLEIGTGWGGFAIHAAGRYGCHVTTTTISREQYDLANKRIEAAGLSNRVKVLLNDYRDLEGQYDKLVSIEMIEAVGHQYLNTYFGQCSSLLKPDGVMLIQAITIADQRYKASLKDVDFIKKFIFPGGFLPSIEVMCKSLTKTTDMKVFHLEDIGPHYARTLADWRARFYAQLEKIREMKYSEAFIRMWEFYFCYCEGGFRERDIGTVQMVLAKPKSRPRIG